MMQKRSADADLHFVFVLEALTQLTPYALGGTKLIESYLDELRDDPRADDAAALLEEAARFVTDVPCHSTDRSAVRRRLIPGEDVVPLSDAAKRLVPVTDRVVALGADIDAMVALEVVLTKLSPQTVRRTTMAESMLLALRQRSPADASKLMGKVRDKFKGVRSDLLSQQLAREWRSAQGEPALPDMAGMFLRSRSIHDVVKPVKETWRRLDIFVRFTALLQGTLPGDTGLVNLAYRAVETLERSLSIPKATNLLESLAEKYERAGQDPGTLPADLQGTRLEPVLNAAQAINRDVRTFVAMSVVLTGATRMELVQTALAESYLDQVIRAVGEPLTQELLMRARSVLETGVEDREQLRVSLRLKLLADQKLGPLARGVMKTWYLGQWEPMPKWWRQQYIPQHPEPLGVEVVSADAYKRGLAWGLAGAHPQGAHQPGFGSWALPPGSGAVV